ncbi:oxidoreductase [Nocardia brasiliensis ATCC 700358]|uniref:Oxidoreductase n=2 Tax=Nocardia brasiliensis TaxID=37326 RepID=K0F2S8_NOCB7|nr:oxidoreductase [Nocardia brasiliensis ATCC 700358]
MDLTMKRFRTGLLDAGLHPRFTPDMLLRSSQMLAAAGGADSLWVPDHLISLQPQSVWTPKYVGAAHLVPRIHACYDPWLALGYLAAKNGLARKRLGIGVTDTGRRNPAVTAQAAATLHLLTGGRSILGIGPGERLNNEPFGVDWRTPVGRFEEAMATIRLLWDSDGAPVSRESPYFPLHNAVFDIPPYRGTRPEVWIAAHGPRMLRIAGRYADAWLPGLSIQPEDYSAGLDQIRTAASDAGRDPMAILPAVTFTILTAPTRDAVDELCESVVARTLTINASAKMWARHGVAHPLGSTFSGAQDLLPQKLDEATMLSYAEKAPSSLVRDLNMVGTPSEIVEQIAEWRDHGVRYAVLLNVSYFQHSLSKGMAANALLVQIMRRLRRL